MEELCIGFVGSGRMATALAQGFLRSQLCSPEGILASDPVAAAREHFHQVTGAPTTASNQAVVEQANVIFLAVKPQQCAGVMADLRERLTRDHLVISIAAGIRLEALVGGLGSKPRLVRVMPNTPCLVGQGASAYCLGPEATNADGELVKKLLDCVGRTGKIDEPLMDAVTGLSGSGPAFVYAIIEALSDGGVLMGLPRDVSTSLAAQTLIGAAEMVLQTGKHPGELKDQVTSPGGTTIAGLAALERGGLRSALISAVEAATERSIELGRR